MGQTAILDSLRAHIAQIEGVTTRHPVLPFGVHAIDRHIPGGGIATGALHEVAGSATLADDAAATIFLAGVLARLEGTIIWCLRWRDLFAPALHLAGLSPDRVIFVEVGADMHVLTAMEECLRHTGLGLRVPPFIAGRCEWRRHRGDDTLASARRAERAARDTRARASALVGRTRTRARRGG